MPRHSTPPGRMLGRTIELVRTSFIALIDTYRLGPATFLAAPLLVAIVVAPQLLQHAVELHMGMFASRDAFVALQNDGVRMAFGMTKVAGLILATIAIARFWTLRSMRRALMPHWRTLLAFALLFGVSEGVVWALDLAEAAVGPPWAAGFMVLTAVTQLFIALAMVTVALEDREVNWRTLVSRRWTALIILAVCLPAAFGPATWLHGKMHVWAFGQPFWTAAGLMALDGLLVGGIASLIGAALAAGYAAAGRRRLVHRLAIPADA